MESENSADWTWERNLSAHSKQEEEQKSKFKKADLENNDDLGHLNDLVGGDHQDSKEEIKEEKPKIRIKKVRRCGLEWRWHP